VFPGTLLTSTYLDPGNYEDIRGRTEVGRRREYIDILEAQINGSCPDLVQLVKDCLHNAPQRRPIISELFTRLQGIRMEVDDKDQHQSSIAKLEVMRQRLALKTVQVQQSSEPHCRGNIKRESCIKPYIQGLYYVYC
jgi:hypothetical protein